MSGADDYVPMPDDPDDWEGPFDEEDEDDEDDEYVPCSICSCLIGDEVAYGDTWDGRWVCAGCAGVEEDPL
jgi:hypothetical protein